MSVTPGGRLYPDDERAIRWSEEVGSEERKDVLAAQFSDYQSAHNDHSCDGIESDASGRYLLKSKERNFATEQTEFDSLKFWNEITTEYNDTLEVGIHSPTPYCHTEREGVIMELINGGDWAPIDYVHSSGQGENIIEEEAEAKAFSKRVGQLAKIMKNEGLHHGDIAERHLLINRNNYELGVIDVEGISRAENEKQIEDEIDQLRGTLDHLGKMKNYKESQVDEWFEEGYNSIPEKKFSGALDRHGFDGFDEDYDFEKLGDSIETVFN